MPMVFCDKMAHNYIYKRTFWRIKIALNTILNVSLAKRYQSLGGAIFLNFINDTKFKERAMEKNRFRRWH